MVKTPCSQYRGMGSSPGEGTKFPHAMTLKNKKRKKKEPCCAVLPGFNSRKSMNFLNRSVVKFEP